jgi:hypothetical protein
VFIRAITLSKERERKPRVTPGLVNLDDIELILARVCVTETGLPERPALRLGLDQTIIAVTPVIHGIDLVCL